MTERFEIVEKALIKMLEDKKYATLRDILITMNPADIAAMLSGLRENKISVISMHLNLDTAQGGIDESLAQG